MAIKWLKDPDDHDFQAAEDYLSLLMAPADAQAHRASLVDARKDILHRKAKDILRASGLPLLDASNKHVAADLAKVAAGQALSPILLIRGDRHHPLYVADGYHRVCASYWLDENTDIPLVLA